MTEHKTTYWDAKDRYNNDTNFRALADAIMHWAVEYKYTPGELRDAAFMAALNYEMMHIRQPIYPFPTADSGQTHDDT